MHGTLTNDEQLKAFRRAPTGYRKVVFSTNVAESSVTISGIVYGILFYIAKLCCEIIFFFTYLLICHIINKFNKK